MPLVEYQGRKPKLGKNVFIAPDAWLIGDVTVGDYSSIFFGAVLRGDIEPVTIGAESNVQELSIFHTSHGAPVSIGDQVTVGHRAILHGCTVKDRCIVGMGSTLLDQAEIDSDCIIGANALVSMRFKMSSRSMAYGAPAKIVRELKPAELEQLILSARHYVEKGQEYLKIFRSP